MDKFFLFCFLLLLFGGLLFALAPGLRGENRMARRLFALSWALVLTVMTVFFPHRLPLLFGDGKAVIELSSGLRNGFCHEDTLLSAFLRDQCLLIDVSRDVQVVPDMDGTPGSHTITDRSKLLMMLQQLEIDTALFEMLVLDVYFQDPDTADAAIRSVLEVLSAQGKLALAYDAELCTNPVIYQNAPIHLQGAFGEIRGSLHEGTYFHNRLFRTADEGQVDKYSLPYRAYAIMCGDLRSDASVGMLGIAHESCGGDGQWVTERMAPRFLVADPTLPDGHGSMLGDFAGYSSDEREITPGAVRVQEVESGTIPLYLLDTLGRAAQSSALTSILLSRRGSGPQVVVVGNFNDPAQDVHNTVSGLMHGPLMVTIILFELLHHGHAGLVPFFLLLLVAFYLVTIILLNNVFKTCPPMRWLMAPLRKAYAKSGLNAIVVRVKATYPGRILEGSWDVLFKDESHFWVMLLVSVFVQVVSGRVINIMSLLVAFAVIEVVLKAGNVQRPGKG